MTTKWTLHFSIMERKVTKYSALKTGIEDMEAKH